MSNERFFSTQVKIQVDPLDLRKPLTESLKGIPEAPPSSQRPKPKTMVLPFSFFSQIFFSHLFFCEKVTTLENGMKIVTEETYQQACGMGLHIHSGTRDETFEEAGVCHLLERMAFTSTKNRTAFQISEMLEAHGVNMITTSTREHIGFACDLIRVHAPVKTFFDKYFSL